MQHYQRAIETKTGRLSVGTAGSSEAEHAGQMTYAHTYALTLLYTWAVQQNA